MELFENGFIEVGGMAMEYAIERRGGFDRRGREMVRSEEGVRVY